MVQLIVMLGWIDGGVRNFVSSKPPCRLPSWHVRPPSGAEIRQSRIGLRSPRCWQVPLAAVKVVRQSPLAVLKVVRVMVRVKAEAQRTRISSVLL